MYSKVLYLDDNEADIEYSKRVFEGSDIQLQCFTSVDAALQELKTNLYTVVISDLLMPIKDGVQFAHSLAIDGISVPIIFTSGVPALSKFSEYKAITNYKGFILKPLTPEKIKLFLEEK